MADDPVRTVVVDDAADVRRILTRQLAVTPRFEIVGEGETGHEAIELAARLRPDLMVLDVSMPEMDGMQALVEVLTVSPATKVVVFSGFSADDVAERARSLGAAAFLDKSMPVDQLPDRLLAVVDARPEVSSPDAPMGGPGGGGRGVGSAATTEGRPPAPSADEVLAAHLERFRDVFERATIGMATATLTGSIMRANPTLVRLTGAGGLQGGTHRFVDLVAPDDRPAVQRAIADVVTGRRDVAAVEHAMRDGAPARWVATTIAAVRDASELPLYLYLQVQDLTVTHEAGEELRRSEERFRLLVDAVADYAIFMLDPTGHISTWNTGAQRIKGYSADEIIGQHFRVFYTQEAQDRRHPEHELELAARDGRYEEEGWRVRKDGSQFWANVVITALFDEHRRLVGYGKVTRDMTERRLVAEERERVNEELGLANDQLRLIAEEKAEFVAVTAHELRNPILAVTGATQLLRRHWEDMTFDERMEILDTLDSSSGRLRRLLDDLLTASRLESGGVTFEVDDVALPELLKQATAAMAGGDVEPSSVAISCADDLVVVADRERLAQMLANLLRNAGTYGRPPVAVTASRAGHDVVIAVRDHGPGVPEGVEKNLFTKFGRDRQAAKRGNGLGLYIVREMARAQHGDAWYERADPGSRFLLRLPAGR